MVKTMLLIELDSDLTRLSHSAQQMKMDLMCQKRCLSEVTLEYQIAVQVMKTVEMCKRRIRSTTLQSEHYPASWILGHRRQMSDANTSRAAKPFAQVQHVVDNRMEKGRGEGVNVIK